ncbi:TraB/GumN family protein [Neisseria sp. 74A18]|uniref:TraB/GumN family protein n=1 Tax=Neisseria sp. 74A18 TaxID=1696094 RepID=UPI0006CAE54C|nr:TraB/GumN family protein [Neisseria sp. 74A18]
MVGFKKHFIKFAGACALLVSLPFAHAESAAFNWHTPQLTSNLWKISKAGQPDSYLLGTIHLGKENKQLSAQAKALLNQTDKLVTEVDMLPDEQAAEEIAAYMGQKMISPKSLREALGEKDFAGLKRYFDRSPALSAFSPVLENLKPWAAVLAAIERHPKGYSAEKGADILLAQAAQKSGKPRGHLETIQDVFDHSEKLSDDLALALLRSVVKHQAQDDADVRTLHRLYVENRFKDASVYMDKQLSKPRMQPKYVAAARKWMEQDLLSARNRAWMPEIKKNTAKQKTLIAVGMGHLVSSEGLIEQLRRSGYTVTPQPALKIWH